MAKSFQFRLFQANYTLKPKMGFGLFCLCFFILFCVLGTWQTHRYHYKKNLLESYQHRLTAIPTPLSQLVEYVQFQTASVSGQYVNDLTMLIQNRYYKSRLGYEVLTPLKIPGEKKLLLIDRGWIQQTNKNLPAINAVRDEQHIKGYIKVVNEYQFILGENILKPTVSPLVIQKIDIQQLEKITHQEFYPFMLRLDASQANGFVRDWTISSVEPQRHLGYAVQWYLMAFVLLIAYLCFCCERAKNDEIN